MLLFRNGSSDYFSKNVLDSNCPNNCCSSYNKAFNGFLKNRRKIEAKREITAITIKYVKLSETPNRSAPSKFPIS